MKQDQHRYLTLPEVADRLGLGKTRRPRKNPGQNPVPAQEAAARAVRRLIQKGDLRAVIEAGRYLVRSDWVDEYEDSRELRSRRLILRSRGR